MLMFSLISFFFIFLSLSLFHFYCCSILASSVVSFAASIPPFAPPVALSLPPPTYLSSACLIISLLRFPFAFHFLPSCYIFHIASSVFISTVSPLICPSLPPIIPCLYPYPPYTSHLFTIFSSLIPPPSPPHSFSTIPYPFLSFLHISLPSPPPPPTATHQASSDTLPHPHHHHLASPVFLVFLCIFLHCLRRRWRSWFTKWPHLVKGRKEGERERRKECKKELGKEGRREGGRRKVSGGRKERVKVGENR